VTGAPKKKDLAECKKLGESRLFSFDAKLKLRLDLVSEKAFFFRVF